MSHYPQWMTRSFSHGRTAQDVRSLVGDLDLTTVCESAVCPNLPECWSQRQLTFMILGDRCTRRCGFCAVASGRPSAPDRGEPWRVAEAVRRLELRHAVITSVARDDLDDEGSQHTVDVIAAVRRLNPGVTIEVLVPDFHGRAPLIHQVLCEGRPDVFAHNIETVERLSDVVRSHASYTRSLDVLRIASATTGRHVVKSSIMLGLGETEVEVVQVFADWVRAGVTHATIGQYLRPDATHLPVMHYVSPEQFERYQQLAYDAGLRWMQSGPYVRSSYHAVDGMDPSILANRTMAT